MDIKFKRLPISVKVSRLIAVIVVSTILATSSLFLNIGVADATHGGIHISGSNVNAYGTWQCPDGSTGPGNVIISVEQQNGGQFVGRVDVAPIIFLGDRISSAQTDGKTFTISGSPRTSCDSSALYAFTFTLNGGCGDGVTVSVSVSNGASGTYPANIQCSGNLAPTANAGADQTVIEGTTVTLDGSGSTDPDGNTLTYSWAQTSGTTVTLSDKNVAKPTFTAPSISTTEREILSFELTVSDGKGGTSKDSVTIVVEDDAPVASLTANPTTINEGETSELDASGSSSGIGISRYEFTQIAGTQGTITQDSTNPARATFTAPQVVADETATIQVTVTDNDGDSSIATADIAVTNTNQAPVAQLTANPTTINEGETSALDASGSSDPDGDPLTYSWSQTAGTPGRITVDSTDPSRATYEAPSVSADETATIQVTVDDGSVGGTDTATVDITVTNTNQAPVAQLTANPTTINEGETSALDASGSSDPDVGDSLTYSFSILDNGLGTISDHTGASDPTATYEAPSDVSSDQTVTIQVEVSDGNGGTDTATAEILVTDNPPPPLTELFSNQGQCIREANTNPDSGITRQDCQEAFVDEEEIEEPEVELEEEEQLAATTPEEEDQSLAAEGEEEEGEEETEEVVEEEEQQPSAENTEDDEQP
jgi:hypothetical protein